MISCAMIMVSTAWRKASTSNCPPGPTNFIRFRDDRLHAESSRNMYSEQGFEALMRAVFLHGCQRFTVVLVPRGAATRHPVCKRYTWRAIRRRVKGAAIRPVEAAAA